MYMCALAGRSCAGAGYQLFAVLQNPQLRQQMTSMRAVVGVVCRGHFKGLTGHLFLGLAKPAFPAAYNVPVSLMGTS